MLALIAGCGALGALAADSVVTVKMADFAYALSSRVLTAGPVTFRVQNVGAVQHDFVIVGNVKSAILEAGGVQELQTVLAPGRYEYLCTVPGHAEAGMKGTLEVR